MRRHDAGAVPSEGPRSHEAEPPALKIWLVGALVVGAAATWPLAARAQAKRMQQIGVLMGLVANDPEAQSRVVAFENGLQELGWVKGRNLSIEYRWAGDGNVLRDHAAELFAMIGPLGDSLEEFTP